MWFEFIFLALVTDVFSRKVAGSSFGKRMRANLAIAAPNIGLQTRKTESLIQHSKQRSQYTNPALDLERKEMSVRSSMGTVGAP